jgi:hypothetical protein
MTKKKIERTPDNRYIIINGRRWRATNPNLSEDERKRLVSELMRARRAVGAELKAGDKAAEEEARARVHAAKVALGERGEKWWEKKEPQQD